MSSGLGNFLNSNSKYASREVKNRTLDFIIASGAEGVGTSEIRKVNGLDLRDHIRLMRQLNDHGAIHRVDVRYPDHRTEHIWSAVF